MERRCTSCAPNGNKYSNISSSTTGDIDWKTLFNLAKHYTDTSETIETPNHNCALVDEFVPLFPSLVHQLNIYVEYLDTPHESQDKKKLVLETRQALRFARQCILPQWNNLVHPDSPSSPSDAPPLFTAQCAAVQCRMHTTLVHLLCCPEVDNKCRNEASKLLCNLITSNGRTARILAREVTLFHHEPPVPAADNGRSNSWLDMITASAQANDRNTIARIAATLHNCIIAALETTNNNNIGNGGSVANQQQQQQQKEQLYSVDFCQRIVRDKLLMCNLIRQIIPTCQGQRSNANLLSAAITSSNSQETLQTIIGQPDTATEWILLLLHKLVQYDLLPWIYESLGAEHNQHLTTLEQVTLLHSLQYCHLHNPGCQNRSVPPLNGRNTLKFLASQAALLRYSGISALSSNIEERYPGEGQCRVAARICMLEILASSLAGHDEDDNNNNNDRDNDNSIRLCLGHETSIVQDACIELATVIDRLIMANEGKRTREIVMSKQDLTLIKVLVRLLGNLSYRCLFVQNLLRETSISPPTASMNSTAESTRTGLHVLFSCTSLSHACFGLREWAIVAIRNVLENNVENQRMLEVLSPQGAINSAELANLGFGIELDKQGHVRVTPPNQG